MNVAESTLLSTQNLIEMFIDEFQFRLSKNTLRSYKYSMESFFNNCEKEYDEIKAKDIRTWAITLAEKGLKPRTIESRMYAIRQFFVFCVEDNYISSNPAIGITIPKKEDKLPFYLEREQLAKLREIVMDSPRDRALIETMYATGARVSEIADLKINDINFDSRFVIIRNGKGKRDRMIPFTIECGERIKEYLSERTDDNDNLFLSNIGSPIRAQVIRRYFEKYSKKLDIKITPHVIRHTMAAHLAIKGMPLYCIQDLLGHDNINTTKVYTRLYAHVRKLQYDQFI